MIIKWKYPAPSKYGIWTEEAAQNIIGNSFEARVEHRPIGEGKIIDAVVSDEGRVLEIMAEWPEDDLSKRILETGDIDHISFDDDVAKLIYKK